jgi:hypothetical protein
MLPVRANSDMFRVSCSSENSASSFIEHSGQVCMTSVVKTSSVCVPEKVSWPYPALVSVMFANDVFRNAMELQSLIIM